MEMRYVTAVVEEAGVKVDQVFFHDPDGYMIEICNCDKIPIIPLSSFGSSASCFRPATRMGSSFSKVEVTSAKCGFMERVMMESLSMDMMNFSF